MNESNEVASHTPGALHASIVAARIREKGWDLACIASMLGFLNAREARLDAPVREFVRVDGDDDEFATLVVWSGRTVAIRDAAHGRLPPYVLRDCRELRVRRAAL